MRPGYDHFNYDLMDGSCQCTLCEDVRKNRKEMDVTAVKRTGLSYGSTSPENMAWRSAISRHAAASNRREIYSEISFLLTWEGMPWKERCLDWLYDIVFQPAYAVDYWWVQCGEERPLGLWVEEWWESTQGTRMAYTRIFDIGTKILRLVDEALGVDSLPGRRGLFIRCIAPVLDRKDLKEIIPQVVNFVFSVKDHKIARVELPVF